MFKLVWKHSLGVKNLVINLLVYLSLLSIKRRIHKEWLNSCRVLWARAGDNHLFDPQEQQTNFIVKNGSGSYTRQIWTSSCFLRSPYYPLQGYRERLNHSFAFWDEESTLRAEQGPLCDGAITASLPRTLSRSDSNSNNVKQRSQKCATAQFLCANQNSAVFLTQTDFPFCVLNQHQPQNIWLSYATNCYSFPIILQQQSQVIKMHELLEINFIFSEMEPSITLVSGQCKRICSTNF